MIYAIFTDDGLPLGFYHEGINAIPEGATPITHEQWLEFLEHQGYRRWDGSAVVEYDPPKQPVVSILYPTDLWRRMTDDEVTAVEAAMEAQTSRIRRIFNAATEYRSDDELWPLLQQIAESLFGKGRASQILAPSV